MCLSSGLANLSQHSKQFGGLERFAKILPFASQINGWHPTAKEVLVYELKIGKFTGCRAGDRYPAVGIPQENYLQCSEWAEELFEEMTKLLAVGEECMVTNYGECKCWVRRPEENMIVVHIPGDAAHVSTSGYYRKAACWPLKRSDLRPQLRELWEQVGRGTGISAGLRPLRAGATADEIKERIYLLQGLIENSG
ncbi:MAG: hypothetical protein ABH814_02580 [bacterium]